MEVFGRSKWIGADENCQSPVISRVFNAGTVRRATLFITAFGYFEVRINGKKITDYYFLPVASDYEPRDMSCFKYPIKDKTTQRLYYYEFNVEEYINEGENTLEIQLGNGWYRQKERIDEGEIHYGEILKTVYKLEIESQVGTVELCSDGNETWTDSQIRYNNIFYGEIIDANFADGTLKPVATFAAPETNISKAIGTPDKAVRTIKPVCIGKIGGKDIFDAGENISGIAVVKTSALKGENIVLRFAEELDEQGNLNFVTAGGNYVGAHGQKQIMEDVFISDGTTRSFEPTFVWHTFRYFEVEGEYDDIAVKVIHSDTPIESSFESNCEGLNFLYDAFVRTQLDNMHGSFPSDCPHRERLGYTGDGQIAAPAAMMFLDCREFYEKWIQDILDCQDIHTGHIQHTAPFMGGGGGPGGWGCAVILVPYAFYKQYGDVDMLKRCYSAMKKWIGYLVDHSQDCLVVREEENEWCLGDWCTPDDIAIPAPFVNTCYFIKVLSIMEEIAPLVDCCQDAGEYIRLRQESEKAVRENFYDEKSQSFADGIQGADAYAVWCGLAGQETADRLAQKYLSLRRFDTGFLATDVVLEVLLEYGHADAAVELLESEEWGTFLYMKRHGATTIWESWCGFYSHCHPMFGAGSRQLFTGLLGIKQKKGTAGYSDISIKPCLPERVDFVDASMLTPKGRLRVKAYKKDGETVLEVRAPQGIKIEY